MVLFVSSDKVRIFFLSLFAMRDWNAPKQMSEKTNWDESGVFDHPPPPTFKPPLPPILQLFFLSPFGSQGWSLWSKDVVRGGNSRFWSFSSGKQILGNQSAALWWSETYRVLSPNTLSLFLTHLHYYTAIITFTFTGKDV